MSRTILPKGFVFKGSEMKKGEGIRLPPACRTAFGRSTFVDALIDRIVDDRVQAATWHV
jgi:hypothetical protein